MVAAVVAIAGALLVAVALVAVWALAAAMPYSIMALPLLALLWVGWRDDR